jgi:hypothetical protein
MNSTRAIECEQFEQAADLLMASLRESRDLNISIRRALLLNEQVDATRDVEVVEQSSATVIGLLRNVLNGVSPP